MSKHPLSRVRLVLVFATQFWKIWEPRPVGKGKTGSFDDEAEMTGGHHSKSGKTGGIKIR